MMSKRDLSSFPVSSRAIPFASRISQDLHNLSARRSSHPAFQYSNNPFLLFSCRLPTLFSFLPFLPTSCKVARPISPLACKYIHIWPRVWNLAGLREQSENKNVSRPVRWTASLSAGEARLFLSETYACNFIREWYKLYRFAVRIISYFYSCKSNSCNIIILSPLYVNVECIK